MDLVRVLKDVGELVGKKLEENVCDVAKDLADKVAHNIPEWLGGEATKKEALDLFEEMSKDIASQVAKQYFGVDIKKYLE